MMPLPVPPKSAKTAQARSVYYGYQGCLGAYGKPCFDIFCREKNSPKIQFPTDMPTEDQVTTNIGQLNAFRWVFETGIYCELANNLQKYKGLMRVAKKVTGTPGSHMKVKATSQEGGKVSVKFTSS